MNQIRIKEIVNSMYPHLDEIALQHTVASTSYIKKPKATKLITAGERHPYYYLILKGSIKTYYLRDSKQVCSWFAFENDIVATLSIIVQGNPSSETIELLEDTEFLQFEIESLTNLAESNLSASHLKTMLITEHATFLEERLIQLQFMTSKERYEALVGTVPEVLQRVSLTDIASFLGVSRETVSRIRATK